MAYILSPLCNAIERRASKNKHKETMAIIFTEIIFIEIIILGCVVIIPQSIDSVITIIEKAPSAWNSIEEQIVKLSDSNSLIANTFGSDIKEINQIVNEFINDNVMPNINTIISEVVSRVTVFGRAILDIIIGIVISIFGLANRKIFLRQTKMIGKAIFNDKTYNIICEEIRVANRMFSGFFVGKLIDSTIIGVACFVILSIMDMPYVLLVSVIVGVTNMIPIMGPFIGAIPSAVIILSESPIKSLYFIIFIIILQQIDGHIIGPKCIGNTTGLSTFWVLFAIMFFGGIWGMIGMVIGVPLFAIIYDVVKKFVNSRLQIKETKKAEETINDKHEHHKVDR
jgi:predicted PurR-regulated permease PerM